jgi:predicted flap endonuclease-1-like 5' DNA nuclease
MAQSNNKQAPRFEMWVIAIAAGLVAAGVAIVVGGFSYPQAGFVALLLALVVIVAFGLAGPDRTVVPAVETYHAPAPVAAPVMAAPVAAPVMAAPAAAPVMAAPVMTAAPAAAAKPAGLSGPRGGHADDLKIVKGIGPKLEVLCHSLGFYHFDQVANWTAAEVAWVDDNLEGFKGRVTRDRWQPQAKAIVAMGPEAFLRELDAGREF